MTGQGDELIEWRISALEQHIKQQDSLIEDMRKQMIKRDEEHLLEERNRLKWGVATLGGVVMSLLGLLWAFRKVIMTGNP